MIHKRSTTLERSVNLFTEKLEKIQNRGLKIAFNSFESSCEERLSRANLHALQFDRLRTIALATCKCITILALLTSETLLM